MWGFETKTRGSCAGVYGAALSFHGSRDTVCNINVRVVDEFGAIDGSVVGVAEEMGLSVGMLPLLLVEGSSLCLR